MEEARAGKQKANQLLQAGHPHDAITIYTQALSDISDPPADEQEEARTLRVALKLNCAAAHLKAGQFEQVVQLTTQVLDERPLPQNSLGKAFARQGQARMKMGRLLEALHDLRSALILMPGDAAILQDWDVLQGLLLVASVESDAQLETPTPFKCSKIERCAWGDSRIAEKLQAGEPVIMSGAPLAEPAAGVWTRKYLAEHMGDKVQCTVFESGSNQFRYFDEAKNLGGYVPPASQMSKVSTAGGTCRGGRSGCCHDEFARLMPVGDDIQRF
eukprot:TRINITY_DN6981_c0_g1_i1.p1 TRINITY_DN6981_c0_g1~~TRINITY_DN6981_c0_g1_i1.p1  ORF type:complete len:272 (+),score=72.57 TRINITY_DN6981_c0_g1_i1:1-816(+)